MPDRPDEHHKLNYRSPKSPDEWSSYASRHPERLVLILMAVAAGTVGAIWLVGWVWGQMLGSE